ncbi:hypothetical protein R1flu_026692 [Riccia fluitans]|uniref:Protein kinase domain-containing protein n=1 Tax=Riccia fluitans TaxID=41844 RepID=A0ABD1XGN2_9MARC
MRKSMHVICFVKTPNLADTKMAEPEPPDFVRATELQRNEDLVNHYTLGDELGGGMFGTSYTATPVNHPTRRVAVKVQNRRHPELDTVIPHEIFNLRLYKEILIVNS